MRLSVASTLRGRLMLLLLIATLPLVGLAIFLHVENRHRALDHLDGDLRDLMGAALMEQDALLDHTEQLLRIMARAEETQDLASPGCSALAARLLDTQKLFSNFGAIDAQGRVVCSGLPFTPGLLSEHPRWSTPTGGYSAMTPGHYHVSRISNRPVISFGLHLLHGDGSYRGAVFAAADAGWISRLVARMNLPADWQAAAVDRQGRVLLHYPPAAPAAQDATVQAALRASGGNGFAELENAGRRTRYIVAPLRSVGGDVLLVVGGDPGAFLAPLQRSLYLQLLLIAGVAGLSFVLSWFGIESSLLRWGEATRDAAVRFGRGDRSVRFGNGSGVAELSDISHAFNSMADAVRAQEAERQAAEAAMRASELKFRAAFEQTYELVGLLDKDGVLREVNDVALQFAGITREQCIGLPFTQTRWWREDAPMQARLQQALQRVAAGETDEFEATHSFAPGRTIQCRLRPIRDDSGAVVWVIAEGRDVTDEKRAAEELRLAATVFEGSRDAIAITSADERILAVNRAFTRMTGYSAAEALGQRPAMLSSGRQDKAFYEAMWRAIDHHGSWRGEIWNRRRTGEVYPAWLSITAVRDGRGTVSHYIGIATDISEHKQAEERIRYLAYHDALTGLPNRRLLAERATQVLAMGERDGKPTSVLFLDVDNFKTVNDSLGYAVGDGLLQALAKRLRAALRDTDTLARTGGDEFLVVLPETNAEGAAHVARKLLALSAQAYRVGEHRLTVGMSIGISLSPSDARDFEALMQHADAAMFRAKAAGRGAYQFYTPEMNAAAAERLRVENSLRRALQRNQFVLHYQPQVSIATGALVGIEALIRWNDPQAGLVTPGKFIPVAEDSGLIVPIGRWVLKEACRQAQAWQNQGLPAVPVAVNLSASQFRQGDIEQTVAEALVESGLEARFLELELTESMVMEDSERTLQTLERLKALGVRLAIDDFGTGYSSLSYLKRFPIDKLKIDRSFVRDIESDADDLAIATAVISLGHSLRLKVIAEGVENDEQLRLLSSHGCDEAQGYHFGRPVPAEQMLAQLRTAAAV